MKRLVVVLAMLVALGMPTYAQTPTYKLAWDHSATLAEVQGYQFTLKVDTAAATVVSPTCVATTAALTTCTTPLAALVSGPHTLVLTAFNGFGSAAGSLSGTPPLQPMHITVTVAISIP